MTEVWYNPKERLHNSDEDRGQWWWPSKWRSSSWQVIGLLANPCSDNFRHLPCVGPFCYQTFRLMDSPNPRPCKAMGDVEDIWRRLPYPGTWVPEQGKTAVWKPWPSCEGTEQHTLHFVSHGLSLPLRDQWSPEVSPLSFWEAGEAGGEDFGQ